MIAKATAIIFISEYCIVRGDMWQCILITALAAHERLSGE